MTATSGASDRGAHIANAAHQFSPHMVTGPAASYLSVGFGNWMAAFFQDSWGEPGISFPTKVGFDFNWKENGGWLIRY